MRTDELTSQSSTENFNLNDDDFINISKKDLLIALWDITADDIYNQEYEIEVTAKEANWIENEMGSCTKIKNLENGNEMIKISVEGFIDIDFRENFIFFMNLDDIESGMTTKTILEKEIDDRLHNLTNHYKVPILYGNKLYPEKGNDVYSNPKTILLEIDCPIVRLEELDSNWNKRKYHLDDIKMIDIEDEMS